MQISGKRLVIVGSLLCCDITLQMVNSGEDVLVFYNDRASFQTLIQMMRSERDRMDENSPLLYHIHLVELLAVCTEGKNVYTEIKCNSLLPLDDIVRVVTHEDCIPEVGIPLKSFALPSQYALIPSESQKDHLLILHTVAYCRSSPYSW